MFFTLHVLLHFLLPFFLLKKPAFHNDKNNQ
uniref:Uncharacterized protein n=1 Tax=Anguilla anguilla TaxID=7936 RepID=A0A0E9U536_ANGAN